MLYADPGPHSLVMFSRYHGTACTLEVHVQPGYCSKIGRYVLYNPICRVMMLNIHMQATTNASMHYARVVYIPRNLDYDLSGLAPSISMWLGAKPSEGVVPTRLRLS